MSNMERTLAINDGIAVITIDNPPVNALGSDVAGRLIAAIDSVGPNVTAIVLHGANGTFCGGADIRGFNAVVPGAPTTLDVIDRLERSNVPVVAAIDGLALGAGLEVALACDYRVASSRAKLGLPEITLGLLPGAGGTQRLPRLIGLDASLAMIMSGAHVSATDAARNGLVDRIAAGNVLDDAIAFAKSLTGAPRRRTSEMPAPSDGQTIAAARKAAAPLDRGGEAAHAALDAIEGAVSLPFAAGSVRERDLFVMLRGGDQSKARRHLFFAEREAAKPPQGVDKPDPIGTATVIGGGTMGTGIAMALANSGIAVTLIEVQADLVARARSVIEGNYDATLRKGKLTQTERDERMARITYATELTAAEHSDIIIEAVFEEMNVKIELFGKLDRIAKHGAILATNTSTLDVDQIARATTRSRDVVGTHFFSPANVMKLLEIVRGNDSSPTTIARAQALAKQLKKIGVVSGNCDGFIGNRMLYPYRRQAEFLLEEGATPEQVDRAIRNFGFAMGPFAMSDLAGLDIGWRIRKRRYADAPPVGRYPKLADVLCEAGRFGQKTGAGYYKYEAGNRTPQADPLVEEMIAKVAHDAGIARRAITDDEIVKRSVYALVNEASYILDEGIAARPGDIDVVWVYGYAFPAFRGGPLHYADTVGLASVYADIERYAKDDPDNWKPAPLLRELAQAGGSFAKYTGDREWATR
ncbi:MAG: 3-hydroxyacyl-CoA dehydrogenase NAD-binding domain-containing protein [Candidatus Velthaea sp.]